MMVLFEIHAFLKSLSKRNNKYMYVHCIYFYVFVSLRHYMVEQYLKIVHISINYWKKHFIGLKKQAI